MHKDQIIERALAASGLDSPRDATFLPGLEIAVRDCNRSDMSPAAREATQKNYLMFLTNRFKADRYVEDHPDVLAAPVKRPVVIVGLPRTGSTLTCNLLAADQRRRSLLSWEGLNGLPPATRETLRTDPRCLALKARDEVGLTPPTSAEMRGKLRAMHHDDADGPSECNMLLAYDFWSTAIEAQYPLPEYREWLLSHPGDAAYAVHKRMLQILQSKAPGTWNLKTPGHSLGVEALLNTYPDARIIWTHRDPFEVVGSHCSLIRAVHVSFGAHDTRAEIAGYYPRQLALHVERLMAAEDSRRLHDGNCFHLSYREMMRDPVEQFRRLYRWLGDDFDSDVEGGVVRWLEERPKHAFGKHDYSLAEFDLSREKLAPLFEAYVARHQASLI